MRPTAELRPALAGSPPPRETTRGIVADIWRLQDETRAARQAEAERALRAATVAGDDVVGNARTEGRLQKDDQRRLFGCGRRRTATRRRRSEPA